MLWLLLVGNPTLLESLMSVFCVSCPIEARPLDSRYLSTLITNSRMLSANRDDIGCRNWPCYSKFQVISMGGWWNYNNDYLLMTCSSSRRLVGQCLEVPKLDLCTSSTDKQHSSLAEKPWRLTSSPIMPQRQQTFICSHLMRLNGYISLSVLFNYSSTTPRVTRPARPCLFRTFWLIDWLINFVYRNLNTQRYGLWTPRDI